ncbi:MAG: hypothetical protein M1829_003070, partial [Trizodia sp. TS-e1964]
RVHFPRPKHPQSPMESGPLPLKVLIQPRQPPKPRGNRLGVLFHVLMERAALGYTGIDVHAQGLLLAFYRATEGGWSLDLAKEE